MIVSNRNVRKTGCKTVSFVKLQQNTLITEKYNLRKSKWILGEKSSNGKLKIKGIEMVSTRTNGQKS